MSAIAPLIASPPINGYAREVTFGPFRTAAAAGFLKLKSNQRKLLTIRNRPTRSSVKIQA